MSLEDSLLPHDWDSRCIVCDKLLSHDEALCHLNIDGAMIAVCCPLCSDAFEKDRSHYLQRRKTQKLIADLRKSSHRRTGEP